MPECFPPRQLQPHHPNLSQQLCPRPAHPGHSTSTSYRPRRWEALLPLVVCKAQETKPSAPGTIPPAKITQPWLLAFGEVWPRHPESQLPFHIYISHGAKALHCESFPRGRNSWETVSWILTKHISKELHFQREFSFVKTKAVIMLESKTGNFLLILFTHSSCITQK